MRDSWNILRSSVKALKNLVAALAPEEDKHWQLYGAHEVCKHGVLLRCAHYDWCLQTTLRLVNDMAVAVFNSVASINMEVDDDTPFDGGLNDAMAVDILPEVVAVVLRCWLFLLTV